VRRVCVYMCEEPERRTTIDDFNRVSMLEQRKQRRANHDTDHEGRKRESKKSKRLILKLLTNKKGNHKGKSE
jgi:hypothetical protein